MTTDLQSALARLRASGLCEARQAAFRKEARLYDKADADPSALVDRIDAAIAACADGQTEELK